MVAIRCNTKMRYEKLKLGYDLISKDVTAEALAGFLGEPSSQFVGNGTLSYHYAFWRGIRRGVYIYTFSIVTHKLQTREMKWL
ncbi:MAG: hypothetical protein HDQ88_08940 [Clostridia bacterium]|nr:hypothetical protein [Clostridia bacterium]